MPSHHVFRIIIHKGITNNRLYITSGRFIITGIQGYMGKKENVSAKTHQGFSKPNDKNYLLSLHNPEEAIFHAQVAFFPVFLCIIPVILLLNSISGLQKLDKMIQERHIII